MKENILEKAAEISEKTKVRKEASSKVIEGMKEGMKLGLAEDLSFVVISGVKNKIIREAKKGNDSVVIMGITTNRAKKEVGRISNYFNSENSVHRQAFELVYNQCVEMKLNPVRESKSTYYGEPIDDIETIVVKWPKKK